MTSDALSLLDPIIDDPTRSLIVLDANGVLAGFEEDALAKVRAGHPVHDLADSLRRTYPVACLTARGMQDAADHLPVEFIAGHFGAQILVRRQTARAGAAALEWRDDAFYRGSEALVEFGGHATVTIEADRHLGKLPPAELRRHGNGIVTLVFVEPDAEELERREAHEIEAWPEHVRGLLYSLSRSAIGRLLHSTHYGHQLVVTAGDVDKGVGLGRLLYTLGVDTGDTGPDLADLPPPLDLNNLLLFVADEPDLLAITRARDLAQRSGPAAVVVAVRHKGRPGNDTVCDHADIVLDRVDRVHRLMRYLTPA